MHTVIAQDTAKRLLSRALEHGRLAHAYLLRGPAGVGKRTFALALARRLLCQRPQGLSGCGSCPACGRLAAGSHPDFLRIQPVKSAISIAQVRELKEALSFAPLESDMRVVIMEDVASMRREAANALLKLLEEPPAGNVLLLCANEGESLLPTITSRCQEVPFFALSHEQSLEVLSRQAPDMEPARRDLCAALSGGSPGLALELGKSGLPGLYQETMDLVDCGRDGGQVLDILALAPRLAALGGELPLFLDLLRLGLRHRLAAGQDPADWGRVEAVDRAGRALARNCNPSLVCETLLLGLCGWLSGPASPS